MSRFKNRHGGRRPYGRARDDGARLILGGGAALLLALACGTATMALLAHERPAMAQPAPKPYVQQDLANQVAKARAATDRCDKVAARREIDKLKKNLELLQGAAKTGVVEGAADDATKLADDIKRMESYLANCGDKFKVTGPGGEIYGFASRRISQEAGKYVDDAQRAVRACDRDFYKAVIKAVRDAIADYKKKGVGDTGPNGQMAAALSIGTLIQLERDLVANEEEAFKKCDPPAKAEPPKAEAPKTGTGTGTPGPLKPPEPPKAPPMTPATGQAPGMPRSPLFSPQDIFLSALFLPSAEFSLALGFRRNDAEGEYFGSITPPGSGEGSDTSFNIGGGVTLWLPVYNFATGVVINPFQFDQAYRQPRPQYAQAGDIDDEPSLFGRFILLQTLALGGRLTLDHLGGGRKEVLELVRHGPNGAVTLTESERSMVSLLLLVRMSFLVNLGRILEPIEPAALDHQLADGDLAQAPRARRGRANWWPVHVYAGGGPSFVRTKITMTSNQVPGGGVFQSVSETKTDTAWSFVLGAQTAVCRNCIFGMPLMAGMEGQWTWLPQRTLSLTSSTFGFSETGRVDSRSSARMMFTLSVPFTIGR